MLSPAGAGAPDTAPMPSTHKKVTVRKHDREAINGYVAPASFLSAGRLELLNTAGKLVTIPLEEIKGVYFVREFSESEAVVRKSFASRPRVEGLWVRLRFRDNEVVEGMMPNDLTQLGGAGFLVTPPDTRGNTQRIFVPRSSLTEIRVLGVIGGDRARRRRPTPAEVGQVPMFNE